MKNKFIVFEGIEACGKSTQIKFLEEYLGNKEEKTCTTAEPTGGKIGLLLREYLRQGIPDSKTTALLFAADRSLHQIGIKDFLEKGYWVICDRYIGSSLAYQGLEKLGSYNKFINQDFIKPDLTFYINIDVETSLERITKRNGIPEYFDKKELLTKIKKDYDELYLNKNDKSIIVIDGTQNLEKVSSEIQKKFEEWLFLNENNS